MMGGGMGANQQGQMRGQKHPQHSPRGKKPHSGKKKGGAFGMGTIENQLMDIIKMQGNCLLYKFTRMNWILANMKKAVLLVVYQRPAHQTRRLIKSHLLTKTGIHEKFLLAAYHLILMRTK